MNGPLQLKDGKWVPADVIPYKGASNWGRIFFLMCVVAFLMVAWVFSQGILGVFFILLGLGSIWLGLWGALSYPYGEED